MFMTLIRLLATVTGYFVWLLWFLDVIGAGNFSLIFIAK